MNERDALQAELDAINAKEDPTPDELNRRKRIMNRLSEIEFASEQSAKHEERIQQSVEQLTNSMDAVELHGLPLREMFLDENRYQLVSIWFKEQLAANTETFSKQIQAEQIENKQLSDELQEAQGIIRALKEELSGKEGQIHSLTFERDEAIKYRDNAFEQLEEARQEVVRLNEHVDTLRLEAAVGARNAIKVTNIEGGKELAEKIKASLTPVTVLEKADILGKQYRIVLADTGEEQTIPFLEKGKYRLVSQEEAAEVAERFRAEKADKERVEESSSGNPALVEAPPLPQFQVPSGLESVQPAGNGEANAGEGKANDADSAKSLEERVAALEAHVFGQAKGAA